MYFRMSPFVNIHTHACNSTDNSLVIYNKASKDERVQAPHLSSFGLHPWAVTDAKQIDDFCAELEKELIAKSFTCVGECGIDRKNSADIDLQIYAFEKQLQLAQKYNAPVIIHCVGAFYDMLPLFSKNNINVPLIFHKYTGNQTITKLLLAYNSFFSYGRIISVPKLVDLWRNIPLQHIFLETDTNNEVTIEEMYDSLSQIIDLDKHSLQA